LKDEIRKAAPPNVSFHFLGWFWLHPLIRRIPLRLGCCWTSVVSRNRFCPTDSLCTSHIGQNRICRWRITSLER
jgi:hypothetical protein